MGAFYETIPEGVMRWILEQKVFWVATAPLAANTKANGGQGHVNVSPKGGPYFGLLSPTQFWYMDLTGSGSETISHLNEPQNGRITILFNAFEGSPRIVRLWGHGCVLENGTQEFTSFITSNKITTIPGSRSIILVDIHQVGSSCGFSVPFYDFKDFRPVLNDYFRKKEERYQKGKEEESMPHYWAFKNAYSMDGLPGMKLGIKSGKDLGVKPIKKMVGPLAPRNQDFYGRGGEGFGLVSLLLVLVLGVLLGMGGAVWGLEGREKLRELVGPVLEQVRTRVGGVSIALPSPAQILRR